MAKVLIGNFKGPKGDKGDKGDPGTAATIQVGTTQTVQPEANAEVTNTGTTSAAVLNFKIPRGEDGMTDLTAEYTDDSSYTCQPTVNAPVILKEIAGKTEQGENPSPDNPQVIKGVGGMGYFDGVWRQGLYKSVDGAWQNSENGICSQNPIKAKAGDSVTLKYLDKVDLFILAYKSDGTYLGNNVAQNANEVSYTLPIDTAYVHIDVQIDKGASITPSDAKYCTVTINGEYQTGVEVHGAQMFNPEDAVFKRCAFVDGEEYMVKSNIQNDYYCQIELTYLNEYILQNKGKSLTLSCSGNPSGRNICIVIYGTFSTGKTYQAVDVTGNKCTIAISNDIELATRMELRVNRQNTPFTDTTTEISNIMLNEGSTALPWGPYHHTAISIPLTSPLYEGDKLCYVKPGGSYVDADGTTVVADRILYGVYRENGRVVLDGSEDENIMAIPSQSGRFEIDVGNTKYMLNNCFCNLLQNKDTESVENDNSFNTGTKLFIRINKFGSDVEALKTWLQSNNLEVVYKLARPYFEPFTDQSIFYGLRTDDTLSYVYSTDPIEPNVTVEVAKNSTGGYLLESYAQAQKNAISEANSQSRLSAIEQQLVNQATTPTE